MIVIFLVMCYFYLYWAQHFILVKGEGIAEIGIVKKYFSKQVEWFLDWLRPAKKDKVKRVVDHHQEHIEKMHVVFVPPENLADRKF